MTFAADKILEAPSSNGADPYGPADALAESRVDLIAIIDNGIPEREFVPGSGGIFARGKRHLIAAERKTGKSIAIGVVAAVDVVLAGGVVVVLDRENGSDEYARRLDAVLAARNVSPADKDLIRRNFRYHAWPQLKLEMGADPRYAQAFVGADVAMFDSSRKFLTSVGLKEDLSDDYSTFTESLIDPLTRVGIATTILDNTGYADKERARGSSAKEDLVDVAYTLKTAVGFSLERTGSLELTCRLSRLGEIEGSWMLQLGGGSYGSWRRKDGADARDAFHRACIASLAETAPLGRDALLKAARDSGVKGRENTLREWLDQLVANEASPLSHDRHGYSLSTLDPSHGPGRSTPPPGPGPDGPPIGASVHPLDPASGPGGAGQQHYKAVCHCLDGGQEPRDHICQRCYGRVEGTS